MIVMMGVLMGRVAAFPVYQFYCALQVTTGVFHLLGGRLDVSCQMGLAKGARSFCPGVEFAGMLLVVRLPVGQEESQLFDLIHAPSPSDSVSDC
jgi:hypothetical protein